MSEIWRPAYEAHLEDPPRCFRVGGTVILENGKCPECGWSQGVEGPPTAHAYEKALNASKTRAEFLERTLREHLWLNHGHIGLYGDDGEMQCAACIPFGVSDYKRQTIEELLEGQRNLGIYRLGAAKPT